MMRSLCVLCALLMCAMCEVAGGQSCDLVGVEPSQRSQSTIAVQSTIDGDWMAMADTSASSNTGIVYMFHRTGTQWAQVATLNSTSADTDQFFGYSISIERDWMAIGAPGLVNNGHTGSVFIYHYNGAQWALYTRIDSPGAQYNPGLLPYATSVIFKEERVYVAAPLHVNAPPNRGSGRAYVYYFDGTAFTLEATLTHPDVNNTGGFARSIAVNNEWFVAGCGDSRYFSGNGTAYIFRRAGSVWAFFAQIFAPTPTETALFGNAVALDNGTLVVGAPRDGSSLGQQEGAAHIFSFNGTAWTYVQRLNSPNDNVVGATVSDEFGAAVAINGPRIIVGAPSARVSNAATGAGYYFEHGANWTFSRAIEPPVVTLQIFPQFGGKQVFISGADVGISAVRNNILPPVAIRPAAYFLSNDGTDVSFVVQPTPVNFHVEYVGLHADTVAHYYGLISARLVSTCGTRSAMQIKTIDLQTVEPYVEVRNGPFTWARIESPRLRLGNGFGHVGPPGPFTGETFNQPDNLFVFSGHWTGMVLGVSGEGEASDADLTPQPVIGTFHVNQNQTLGTITMPLNFEIHPHTGLPWGEPVATTQSTVVTTGSLCEADFNIDGVVDFFDYLDFVQEFASNGARSDFNRDGITDFFDYLDFVNAFAGGC